MLLQAGSKLGPYEIAEPIGQGGMGEVYRARDTRLDRGGDPSRNQVEVVLKYFAEIERLDPVRSAR